MHGGISKIFLLDHSLFTIIFRPEILEFHPYSNSGRICYVLCVKAYSIALYDPLLCGPVEETFTVFPQIVSTETIPF